MESALYHHLRALLLKLGTGGYGIRPYDHMENLRQGTVPCLIIACA